MGAPIDQVLSEAMKLAPEDRAKLAAELLSTLQPDIPAESRSEKEWLAEITRRARAALAGEPGLSWAEVKEQVRKRLSGV